MRVVSEVGEGPSVPVAAPALAGLVAQDAPPICRVLQAIGLGVGPYPLGGLAPLEQQPAMAGRDVAATSTSSHAEPVVERLDRLEAKLNDVGMDPMASPLDAPLHQAAPWCHASLMGPLDRVLQVRQEMRKERDQDQHGRPKWKGRGFIPIYTSMVGIPTL